MDFAIIKTGGKQYKVIAGQKLQVEKLTAKQGENVSFGDVLLRSIGGKIEVGTPTLSGAAQAKVTRDVRGEKKIIFKYHSKTRQRRKKGHRQDYTEVEITRL